MSSTFAMYHSVEMFEAQHRVKLLSFLLLVICGMELLTLATVFLGDTQRNYAGENDVATLPPGDPTDIPYHGIDEGMETRDWQNSDYFDLILNFFGFYVATLGIKATTENTRKGVRKYFAGLLVVGMCYVAYDYFLAYQRGSDRQEQARESKDADDDFSKMDDILPEDDLEINLESGNLYLEALMQVVLPIAIWFLCFLRAWQLQKLVNEAELESERVTRENIDEMTEATDDELTLVVIEEDDEIEQQHIV